ncbi:MAG TPA: FtsW/RodA/SpoVE family cell cycle protein, partial [Rectinemataceae bacterium]
MRLDPDRKLVITRTHPELEFLGACAVLMALGFVAMWTSSSGYAIRKDLGASYFAFKQAKILAFGLGVFVVAYLVPLDFLRSKSGLLAILSLAFLLTPFIPGLGVELNGGRRWIRMGFFNFQPSEIWKIASVFYAAHVLDKRRDAIRKSAVEAIFPFIVVCAGVGIIFLQDDFSTSILAFLAPLAVFWL